VALYGEQRTPAAVIQTTYTTPVTLAITSGTGTTGAALSCTANPATPVVNGGYVAFSGCSIDQWGTGFTLTATSGSLTSAAGTAFDVYQFTPALTLTNHGATQGKPEATDTIAITYPDPISASTFCGGWSGSTINNVTVNFTNSGPTAKDTITSITDTTDCTGTAGFRAASGIGNIVFGTAGKYFTSATGSFTASATWNSSTNTLLITLTALSSGTVGTGTSTTATYTPDATLSVPASASFTTANGKQF